MTDMSAGRIIPDTFMGGVLPVKFGNDTIGAIGVGGAPESDKDEACATAGLAKIQNKLSKHAAALLSAIFYRPTPA